MINRRKNYCFLLSVAINRHLCNRHCRCYCLMAVAGHAFSITCKDPFRYSSDQRNSLPAASSTVKWSGYEGGRCIGLGLKGCCSSENSISSKNGNCYKSSGFNDNNAGGGSAFELHKVRATSPPSLPQQSLREFVSEENRLRLTNRFDSRADGAGACQNYRENCLQSFGDRQFSEKIMVAVDVDEVLGNFVSALNQFIADRYSSNHSVSEYHVYEFFKIWNCSRDEANMRVHEFFKTSYFKKGIHPIPGALQALQNLSRFYSLSIVTSRQHVIKDHTIEWIEKHYPGLFQEIHFGNHFALDGKPRPKSEICRSLGAKVLIDDNPRYAIECAEVGIRVLLFDYENSYPWSKTESVKQHPLVTRVHNWEEVEHQLVSDEILTAICDS